MTDGIDRGLDLAKTAYRKTAAALTQVTGQDFQQADHPAQVLRTALPGARAVYGWWGNISNAHTGKSYFTAPGFVLWDTGTSWCGIMVRDREVDKKGWSTGSWFFRAELLHRALSAMKVDTDLFDLALRLLDPAERNAWDAKDANEGLVWGASRVLDTERFDGLAMLVALRGQRMPGPGACDARRGLWEQTVDGPRMVIEPTGV